MYFINLSDSYSDYDMHQSVEVGTMRTCLSICLFLLVASTGSVKVYSFEGTLASNVLKNRFFLLPSLNR